MRLEGIRSYQAFGPCCGQKFRAPARLCRRKDLAPGNGLCVHCAAMSGYGFFRSLYFIVGLGLTAVMSVLMFTVFAIDTVVTEVKYRNRFGADWQAQFENNIGPVV